MRSRGLSSVAVAALLAGSLAGAMAFVIPAFAASPSSSSIGPSKSSTGWSGKYFALGSTPGPGACPPSIDQNVLCDHFNLSVGVDHSYWNSHTGGATMSISWGSSDDNVDLYVYSGGS